MSFEPFTAVTGPAAVLMSPNIDTDVIIRVDHLTKDRSEVGQHAFEALRYRPDGSEDPEFPLNRAGLRHAPILVTGPNFGCGSSREPAVWALYGIGIRCIIGTTFGDIFLANCAQNGLLVVPVPPVTLDEIAQAAGAGQELTVDLVSESISGPVTDDGGSNGPPTSWTFAILPSARSSLMQGLDDIELAVQDQAIIQEWQDRDMRERPWIWATSEPHF